MTSYRRSKSSSYLNLLLIITNQLMDIILKYMNDIAPTRMKHRDEFVVPFWSWMSDRLATSSNFCHEGFGDTSSNNNNNINNFWPNFEVQLPGEHHHTSFSSWSGNSMNLGFICDFVIWGEPDLSPGHWSWFGWRIRRRNAKLCRPLQWNIHSFRIEHLVLGYMRDRRGFGAELYLCVSR